MPVIKSAIKKARQDEKARKHNKDIRASFRGAAKDVRRLAETGQAKKAEEALKKAYSEIDKAAKRNIIHKNNASRRKSRLAALLIKKETKPARSAEGKETAKEEK